MAQIIPAPPFDYVVFGALGDLAKRKLFPALFHRERDGQLPPEACLIGAGRKALSNADFQALIRDALIEHGGADSADPNVLKRFLGRLSFHSIDVSTANGFGTLAERLAPTKHRPQVFYLALAPHLFAEAAKFLVQAGLNHDQARLVLEKPLGTDLASSAAINDAVGAHFREEQIYRIDHYLGKESVQNLLALRFGNVMFERIWNAANIDHVQITAAETVGLGERAAYYDGAGALRDMVQNHLLQLLCLTAMEPPSVFDAGAIRDEKRKVLTALRPLTGASALTNTVRGQYSAGLIDGKGVPAYADELGVPSRTETYVALKTEIDNWRWAGVPFYLRTGKRLPARYSEIVVQFKAVPHSIFEGQALSGNQLIIRLQPDEGVKLRLMTKDPGPGGMRLRDAALDLSFAEEFALSRFPDAYERLLLDVVRGNSTLFMRNDELAAAWTWIDPILAAWQDSPDAPELYSAGTLGPSKAALLLGLEGRTWHEETRG